MRYFFDIYDGDHWSRDDRGIECHSLAEARHQAVQALTEMAREYLPHNGDQADFSIRIRTTDAVALSASLVFRAA